MPFELPKLPYAYDALLPHIDAKTMEIHHTKHHKAYIDKANAALAGTGWENKSVEEVIRNLDKLPQDKHTAVRNNAGGHANHSLFWTVMKPQGGGKPAGPLAAAIDKHLGGFDKFKEEFATAAANRFGSGWAWLVKLKSGELAVTSTDNQDSPLMNGKQPILGCDVWEHSYYIDYRNARPKYLEAWFDNLVNWEHVEAMLGKVA